MRCTLLAVPETIFPFAEDGTRDDLYKVCEHCGEVNSDGDYWDNIIEISTRDADDRMPGGIMNNSWSLNCHAFDALDAETGGLLRTVVGDYEEGRCIRLFRVRDEVDRLRKVAETMKSEHFRSFLLILTDYIANALQEYGERAVIFNS